MKEIIKVLEYWYDKPEFIKKVVLYKSIKGNYNGVETEINVRTENNPILGRAAIQVIQEGIAIGGHSTDFMSKKEREDFAQLMSQIDERVWAMKNNKREVLARRFWSRTR